MKPASDRVAGSRWEHFPHQADIGIRGVGPSLQEAFRQAAVALTAVITDSNSIEMTTPVAISVHAGDAEDLLFDWLNALVFEMATRDMLFKSFDVEIDDGQLTATAWGEPVSIERHRPVVEVKGATYTGLRVFETDNGDWIAECVVDV